MTEAPRIKALGPWFAELKHLWFCVGVLLVALVFALRSGVNEPQVRWTGMVLQLLGVLTVAWGISETRALFGHPSFANRVKGWLGRFPLRKRNILVGVGSGHFGVFGGNARGYTSFPIDPTAPIADRVTAVEKNIEAIQQRITSTQAEMDTRLAESKDALEKERSARKAEDSKLHDKIEASGTGGIHISAIGAAWLFFGVILSTASVEIQRWVN